MKRFSERIRRGGGALLAGTLLASAGGGAALAGDAQPRDFLPAPAGTHLALLYYFNNKADTYVDGNGNEIPGSGLETNVGIARYLYFFDIGNMRADLNVVQPFGGLDDLSIGGTSLESDSFGLGDTSIVFTVWPLNDPERNRYFAVATYVTLPTGDYDSDVASLGTNRWAMTVQPAYYFDLAPKWTADLVGDVTIYGDNDSGPGGMTIEKDPDFTALGWLNYHANDRTTFSVGVSHTWGGEETRDGVGLGDFDVTTVRAAWSQMLTPTTQLVAELGTDVDAENSFERDRAALIRIARFF
jgi:hypothetical protein